MMRTTLLASLASGLVLAGSGLAAQAMPIGRDSGPGPMIEHVRDGCGPGGFRGYDGYCRPMRRDFGPPGYGPRGYGPGGYGPPPPPGYGPPRYGPPGYGPPRFYNGY